MSYLDTMYDGLFKEAAPTFGTTFNANKQNQPQGQQQQNNTAPAPQPQNNAPAPVQQPQRFPMPRPGMGMPRPGFGPRPGMPMSMPAIPQGVPRQPVPQPQNPTVNPLAAFQQGMGQFSRMMGTTLAPIREVSQTMAAANQQQKQPAQPKNETNLYTGMPQTSEAPIGGTGNAAATLAPNQKIMRNSETGEPFIVEYADRQVAPKYDRDDAQNSIPVSQYENRQQTAATNDYVNRLNSSQAEQQFAAIDPASDARRVGIDVQYLNGVLDNLKKNTAMTPEQKLAEYQRYLKNVENAVPINDVNYFAAASVARNDADINDEVFRQSTGRAATLDEYLNMYGTEGDLPTRFRFDNITTPETLQILDKLKENPAGVDKALGLIGSQRGIDPALLRSKQFQQLTPDQQATYVLAAVEQSVSEGTSLMDKAKGIFSKGDTKTNIFDSYAKTPAGQKQLKSVINSLSPQTMSAVCERLGVTGDSTLSPETESFLRDTVKTRCWDALSDNFFGNLPSVIGLWFKSMGWQQMGGIAENPWMFYGGLITLLLGGGALIGNGLGLFGGGGGDTNITVSQSPQDSYRQNLYRTF